MLNQHNTQRYFNHSILSHILLYTRWSSECDDLFVMYTLGE